MSWMFSIFLGIALLVVAGGAVNWVTIYMEGKRTQMQLHADGAAGNELARRLEELEARMRDVLDVMLALSDKMDRWDRDGATSPRPPATPAS